MPDLNLLTTVHADGLAPDSARSYVSTILTAMLELIVLSFFGDRMNCFDDHRILSFCKMAWNIF